MGKKAYVGVSNKARTVKNIYVGVGGKARKVVKGYVGVNGVARQFWPSIDGWKTIFKDGVFVDTWPMLVRGITTIADFDDTYNDNPDSWKYTMWRTTYGYQSGGFREFLTTPIFMWDKLYAQTSNVPYGWYIEDGHLCFSRADSQSVVGARLHIPIKRAYNLKGFEITGTLDPNSSQQYGDIETGLSLREDAIGVPGETANYPTVWSGQRFWIGQYKTIKYTYGGTGLDYADSINIELRDNVIYKIKEIRILCDYDYLCATHEPDEYTSGKIEEVNYDDIPGAFRAQPLLPPAVGYHFENYQFAVKNNNARIARVLIRKRNTNEVRIVLLTDNPNNLAGRYISIYDKRNPSYVDFPNGWYVWNEIEYAGHTYYVYGFGNDLVELYNMDPDIYTYVNSNISGDWRIGEIAYYIFDGTTTRKAKEV